MPSQSRPVFGIRSALLLVAAAACLAALGATATAGGTGFQLTTDPAGDTTAQTPAANVQAADVIRLGATSDANDLHLWIRTTTGANPPAAPSGNPGAPGVANQVAYSVGFDWGTPNCYGIAPSYRNTGAWTNFNVYTSECSSPFGAGVVTPGVTLPTPAWNCSEAHIRVPWGHLGQTGTPPAGTTLDITMRVSDNSAENFRYDSIPGTFVYTVGNQGNTLQAPPTTISAQPTGENQVTVTWLSVDNGAMPVSAYRVYREVDGSGSFVLVGTVSAPLAQPAGTTMTFDDTTAPLDAVQGPAAPTTTVRYAVSAENCQGEGAKSAATPSLKPDFRPTAPVLSTTAVNPFDATLSWTAAADCPTVSCTPSGSGASGVYRYELYRSSDATVDATDALVCICDWSTRTRLDSGLAQLTTYHYAVRALDNRTGAPHVGPFSNVVKVDTPESDYTPPTELTITSGSVELHEFAAKTVTPAMLHAADPVAAASALVFTIDGAPALAGLELSGSQLGVGDTFTQDDIDQGRLKVVSLGGLGADIFKTTVSNGAETRSGTMAVTVVAAAVPTADMRVSSGPYFGGLRVDAADSSSAGFYAIGARSWRVNDATGNLLGSGTSAAFTFTPPGVGVFTITLEVTDLHGRAALAHREIRVDEVFRAAKAQFMASETHVEVGDTVTFWDTSEAGSVPIVGREWDFRDSQVPSTAVSVQHSFSAPGTYLVTLRIQDKLGNEHFATGTVIVDPASATKPYRSSLHDLAAGAETEPPRADAGPDQVVLQGSIVELDGSLSRPGAGATSVTYLWSLADGIHAPLQGIDTAKPRVAVPFLTQDEAEILLRLVVTDDKGRVSDPDVVRLLVRREGKPSLQPVAAPTGIFDFQASVTGNVSFSAQDAGPGAVYSWDFGDGTTETSPSRMTRHHYASSGVFQVRLRVEDGFGRVAEHQRAVVLEDPAEASPPADGTPQDADAAAARPGGSDGASAWPIVLAVAIIGATLGAVAFVVVRMRRARADSQKA